VDEPWAGGNTDFVGEHAADVLRPSGLRIK
jgi:hypothetical protein